MPPRATGDLQLLDKLDLTNNQFVGNLPSGVCKFRNFLFLIHFITCVLDLTNVLPIVVLNPANWSNVNTLYLDQIDLFGSTYSIRDHSRSIDLYGVGLAGCIPPRIGM